MCYVKTFQAPLSVWKAYHRGSYVDATPSQAGEWLTGLLVRAGTYGDPMAVPFEIWEAMIGHAEALTGYSHQWLTGDQRFKAFCMASADTPEEMAMAHVSGWRTFRVRKPDQPIEQGEVMCPASKEAGFKTNCASCKACGGLSSKAKVSMVIIDHGPTRKRAA